MIGIWFSLKMILTHFKIIMSSIQGYLYIRIYLKCVVIMITELLTVLRKKYSKLLLIVINAFVWSLDYVNNILD